MEVFAELDVQASNRQTLMSARNEALRAAEQRVLDQARERDNEAKRRQVTSKKEPRILNEINASQDTAAWEARHKVSATGKWRLFERGVGGTANRTLAVLTILDAYLVYYEAKMARYVMAPYVLEDEQGLFTLEASESLLSSRYYKAYASGRSTGQKVEISAEEFREWRKEAEALWGTTDWQGDFVPGLLNRELPVVGNAQGI